MKLHLIKPFVLWILKKIVSIFTEVNRSYRKTLSREPGLATFIWCVVTGGSTVIAGMIGAVASQGNGTVAMYSAGAVLVISIIYFVYHSFSLMFAAFTKDRQDLFTYLKD